MVRQRLLRLALFLLLLPVARHAAAQVTSLGTTNSGPAANGAVSGVAYSDKADVFLHVWETSDFVRGRFISSGGTPLTASFVLAPSGGTSTRSPSVHYSRGAFEDVFLVVYVVSSNPYAQTVRFNGSAAVLGTPVGLPGAPPVAFAFDPRSRSFLMAWGSGGDVYVATLGMDGRMISSERLGSVGFSMTARDVALNWSTGRYAVEADAVIPPILNRADYLVVSAPVDAATGRGVGPFATVTTGSCNAGVQSGSAPTQAGAVYLPEVNDFFRVWMVGPCFATSGHKLLRGRVGQNPEFTLLDTAGNDMSRSADYSADCRCVLVVSEASSTRSSFAADFIDAVMLDGLGQLTSAPFRLSAATTTTGSFKPVVRATRDGQFVVAYATDQGAIVERFAAPLASSPGPKFSNVFGYLDSPSGAPTVGTMFGVKGWAVDFADVGNVGTDGVHVWAFPHDGRPPVFLTPSPNPPAARDDVAAVYGSQFRMSGFEFTTNTNLLTEGTYTIVAYPHSRVTGAFTRLGDAVVTVASRPAMSLDAPTAGTLPFTEFTIDGWAVDLAYGCCQAGVDTVHTYAFPVSGGAPIFLGATGTILNRPDVAAAFGSHFAFSGFRVAVSGLAAGTYDVGVYARSLVSGTFNNAKVVRITVPAAVARVEMNIDTIPQDVGRTIDLTGWAIDGRAPSGAGVDVVHVWAFPVGGGAPIFVGSGPLALDRQDVASAFGARFLRSGFQLRFDFAVTPGLYDVNVYAHSVATGAFDQFRTVRMRHINNMVVAIDTPGPNATVKSGFTISGWAIERDETANTGIASVTATATLVGGATTALGTATYGQSRPDVSNIYGSQYVNCGYALVTPALPAGTYDITVTANSARHSVPMSRTIRTVVTP